MTPKQHSLIHPSFKHSHERVQVVVHSRGTSWYLYVAIRGQRTHLHLYAFSNVFPACADAKPVMVLLLLLVLSFRLLAGLLA